jgi:hypothetical protein
MTLARRLTALEARGPMRAPRYAVLWGDDDAASDCADNVIRVVWVRPDGSAIFALPHNGRDPLPGDVR